LFVLKQAVKKKNWVRAELRAAAREVESESSRLLVHVASLLNALFGPRRDEAHPFDWTLLTRSMDVDFNVSNESSSLVLSLFNTEAAFRRQVLVYVDATVGLGLKVDTLQDSWGYFNFGVFDISFQEKTKHLDVVLRARAISEAVQASSKPARAVDHLLRSFDILDSALNTSPGDAWLWYHKKEISLFFSFFFFLVLQKFANGRNIDPFVHTR
jgi:hypothetical protein